MAWRDRGRHDKDWTAARDIVAQADKPNLGIVLDRFHICVRGNPIEPIAALPPERIALAQVADAPNLQMDPLSLSRHYRCYPGQGDFPIVDYLDAVRRACYRGPVSLELFNEQFRGASAGAIATDGMRSLRAAGEALAKRRPSPYPPLPPAPEGLAAEFVEFAVADKQAAALAGLLRGLGLAHVGEHRSKAVDLYAQGEARFVVISERDPFARLHSPSVCALRLKVDFAASAMERAQAMDCAAATGRVGPGEALIPAVGAVEGRLIYFGDDRSAEWRDDFVMSAPLPAGPLTRIDHLNNVVRRSEALSWSLSYKTVLGLVAEPQVEVAELRASLLFRDREEARL